MKKQLLSILASLFSYVVLGQAPVVYINFVSHNEPRDSLHKSFEYAQTKPKVMQLAGIISSKNAAWNLGTCDYFIDGALNYDNAAVSPNDVFELLSAPTYSNIEIDARTKNHNGRNAADAIYLLDSCGASHSSTISGFTWYSSNPLDINWWVYSDTLVGNRYHNKWKANIIWGAGSAGHTNDMNDYGMWKPDTTTNFYAHNPLRTLWFQGNGCAPKLDTLSDEQTFISDLKNVVDSIQSGLLPSNKFYCFTITLGQDEFGPTLFNQISTICDSVNSWGSSKIRWATISQKLTAFQTWQGSSGLDYSQWLCGQTLPTGITNKKSDDIVVYPNPFKEIFHVQLNDHALHQIELINYLGQNILSLSSSKDAEINLSKQPSGIYFLIIDHHQAIKVIKVGE